MCCACAGVGDCLDVKGHYVKNGETFSPAGKDPYTFCTCVDGKAKSCMMAKLETYPTGKHQNTAYRHNHRNMFLEGMDCFSNQMSCKR